MPIDAEQLRRIEAAMARPEDEDPPLQRRHLLFRFRRSPSRQAISHAWVVVRSAEHRLGSRPIVREVRVDRGAVARGAPGGIRVRDAEVGAVLAHVWMRELFAVRVPLGGVEENIGLDGTTYTLSTKAGFASADLRWWCDGPSEWSELTAWARRTMAALHACVAPDEPLDDEP